MGKKNYRKRKNKLVEDEDFGSVELHGTSAMKVAGAKGLSKLLRIRAVPR